MWLRTRSDKVALDPLHAIADGVLYVGVLVLILRTGRTQAYLGMEAQLLHHLELTLVVCMRRTPQYRVDGMRS